MSDLFEVSGKTALVTGGSRGIGLMIAHGLVQAGARTQPSPTGRRLAITRLCENRPSDDPVARPWYRAAARPM